MATVIDWSIILGTLSIAGAVVVKWLIPGILALSKDGGGATIAQAASRDLVEAINNAVNTFSQNLQSEIVKMTEWRTGQRALGEHVLAQVAELTDKMQKLTDAVAVVQRQQLEAVREIELREREHGDAFAHIAAIAKKVKA